jgi:5-methylcytosine-specific restriction protein B
VAFARNDLAVAGYIDKSIRGVWTLTEAGMTVDITDEMASDLFKNTVAENAAKRSGDSGALADSNVDTIRYWIYAPGSGAEKWDECYKNGIMLLGWGEIGDLNTFDSKDEMKQKMKEVYGDTSSYKNSAHATWQFVHDLKPGDVVFVKKGIYGIIGRGVVESAYEYDAERSDEFNNVRAVKWTHKGDWTIQHQTPQKTLTDITPYSDFVQQIKDLFDDEILDEDEDRAVVYPPYTVDDFLDEVYMDEDVYDNIVAVLRNKKNIILQGAPGVGKTFVAKRLAYAIMGVKDVERVMMVQFHQSYSYEDFIMGFRPTATGFELRKGAFYNFCKKAEIDSDNDYFFIIDEINRGNLSKIFGELFMLIENDKRGIELQLLYSDEKFAVPKNVYIIGMMNTADRSLAMLDYALRRRFAFFDIKPGFETPGFREYRMALDNEKFNKLISCVENLNRVIAVDESLGEGFCIGHSYFCNLQPDTINDDWLYSVVEYELIPLLKEYWFDEPTKVKDWSENLRSAIK